MSRLLAIVLTLAVVAPAAALTVDAARVQIGGRRGDVFRVQGRFDPASVTTATTIAFRLDTIALELPVAAFARKKNVLTYKGGKTAGALGLLRLDLGKGKFLATGRAWRLGALVGPFAVGVGSDCGMAAVETKGRKKTGKRTLVQSKAARAPGGCTLGMPQLRPLVVRTGTPTTVEVEVPVAGSGVTGLQLRRTGADAPLCTLAPVDGDPARQGCVVTIDEAAPVDVQLRVEGTRGGARTTSPGVTLPVLPEPTDADVAAANAAIATAGDVWLAAKARLGDRFAARMDAIATLQTTAGIASAGLSANGVDIVLRFANGWQGFLVLNRPVEGQRPAPAATIRPAPVPRRPSARGVFRSCGDSNDVCCPIDRRVVQERRDVVIWDPNFIDSSYDDALEASRRYYAAECAGFTVTLIAGTDATIASLNRLSDFATVVMSTHGTMARDGRTHVCAREPRQSYDRGIRRQLDDGDAGLAFDPGAAEAGIMCMSETYMRRLPGRFPENAIVYASYCYSARGGMPSAFVGRGAGAFFGFDWAAGFLWTRDDVAPALFGGLLEEFRTTGTSWEKIDPKTDPQAWDWHYDDPATGNEVAIPGRANVVLIGDPNIAYAGKPELTASADSIRGGAQATFDLHVPGAGTCELTHHWHNSADYGHLDGGDDVESSETSYTFTARDDAFGGADGIGVEVLPKDGDEPIGVACGGVFVASTCGDAIRQPEYEACDLLDTGDCPAGCTLDCTCEGTTTSSSVTTTVTTSTTTTTEPPECETSADCGALACCDPSGFCCPAGGPCRPGPGPVFDALLTCSYTVPPEELTPISPACGASTPASCPADAVLPVSFVCETCADDGKYLGYLLDSETGERTPFP